MRFESLSVDMLVKKEQRTKNER